MKWFTNVHTVEELRKQYRQLMKKHHPDIGGNTEDVKEINSDIRFMLYEDSMNQQRLIQFMDRLVRTSNRKVFLILDNIKVHYGKKAAAWLDRHRDKIELFFLPLYAPESNPDEYLNHALKLSVHSGDLPRTQCDIRHKTASFMRTLQHSPDKVSAFFHHNQISYILIRE